MEKRKRKNEIKHVREKVKQKNEKQVMNETHERYSKQDRTEPHQY
jgi:hypothetical protein